MNRVFILTVLCLLLGGEGLAAQSLEIDVVSPVKAASKTKFSAQGIVQSEQNITINSQSSGFFKPKVFINSFVKKGQLLGTLKNSARNLQIRSLKTRMYILKHSIQLQAKQIKSNQEMLKLGIISKNKMLANLQQYQIQELKLQQTQQTLNMLLLYQKHANIYATQSGYIKYIASHGQYLSYGAVTASIIPNKQIVKLFIDPSYLKYIFKNESITLLTPQGKQSAVISEILPQSTNNLIEIIAKPAHQLPLGMNLQAKLTIRNINGWNIPKSAIVIKDNKPAIYIIRDGLAKMQFVHILKDMIQTVIISNNLTPNDKIADKSAYMLSNNMKVMVK